MPKAFYYRYNLAREALGKDPVMFYIQEFNPEAWKEKGLDAVEYYQRKGNHLSLYGMFPVDEDGNPILKWIGVEINDADSVTTDFLKNGNYFFHIDIKLKPQTVIRALVYAEHDEVGNPIKDGGMVWMQIYAGPQTMTFNYKIMKERRKALGYTQNKWPKQFRPMSAPIKNGKMGKRPRTVIICFDSLTGLTSTMSRRLSNMRAGTINDFN